MEENYSLPVYTSLMHKNPFLGIGYTAFSIIALITILLSCLVSLYCSLAGVILYAACRFLICREEPFLLDFIFENLTQTDYYEG